MEFGYSTHAGFGSSTAETPSVPEAPPENGARDTAGLDRIIELLALSRVRIAMVALDFGDASPRLARLAASAAAGTTGFLIALDPRRFVIVDVGPRGASPRDDQAIAERVRALAMAVLSGRVESRRVRLRSAELHLWSDQAGSATQRLSELERLLAADDRPAAPPRDLRRRVRVERFARVA
jgi:hypothetical protein